MAKKVTTNFKKYLLWFWGIVIGGILLIFVLFYITSTGTFGALPTFEELENPQTNLATEVISSDGVNWTRIRDGGQSGVHLFLHQNKYHYFLPSNLQVIQHDDIYHFLQPANLIISKEQADSTNFYMNGNLIFSTTDGGVHYLNNLSEWEFVSIQQNAEFLDMLYLNGKYILVGILRLQVLFILHRMELTGHNLIMQ